VTKAELEAKVADLEDEAERDAGERERLKAELKEAEDALSKAEDEAVRAEDEAERAEDEALKPMRTAYDWLYLLRGHLDRLRDGLMRRASEGRALPRWERWEERARECLDGAQDVMPL
jgi:chromosome segregation ATPase